MIVSSGEECEVAEGMYAGQVVVDLVGRTVMEGIESSNIRRSTPISTPSPHAHKHTLTDTFQNDAPVFVWVWCDSGPDSIGEREGGRGVARCCSRWLGWGVGVMACVDLREKKGLGTGMVTGFVIGGESREVVRMG